MDARLLDLAGGIIQKSSRERPADAVLRDELKAHRGISRRQSAEVSRALFAYYRWYGWLDKGRLGHRDQVQHALELARNFALNPESVSDLELLERAVPNWVRDQMEVLPEWARTLQTEPRLWLRARSGQGKALAAVIGDCYPYGEGPLADALEYTGEQDLFRLPEFQAGEFELQDISSQAVGLACDPQPGETWWDVCAGEGGKMLHLSDLMQNQGLIWATDRVAWRLQKLKRRAARAKVFNYRAALWDAAPRLPTKTKFDGVLIDAPCSGIGTWQRNPHARWTTTPQDIEELSALQQRILDHAAPALKAGGKLIYAVCTPARSETVNLVEAFQPKFAEFKPLALNNPLAPSTEPTPQHYLWPQHFGGNAMFIASWRRS